MQFKVAQLLISSFNQLLYEAVKQLMIHFTGFVIDLQSAVMFRCRPIATLCRVLAVANVLSCSMGVMDRVRQ